MTMEYAKLNNFPSHSGRGVGTVLSVRVETNRKNLPPQTPSTPHPPPPERLAWSRDPSIVLHFFAKHSYG